MGVYIKGMKMPHDCLECMVAQFCKEYEEDDKRPYGCPLIKVVEPHGRIVDESKINTVYGQKDILTTSYYGSHTDGFLSVTEYITGTDAPTVIEREGE